MQGTWKEKVGGWNHKDCRRKTQTRKHTVKEKFSVLSSKYNDAERKNEFFSKDIFRTENDDLILVYENNSKRTVKKLEAKYVSYYGSVFVTLKSKKEFKILRSVEDLDKNSLQAECKTFNIIGKAVEIRTETGLKFRPYSYEYFDITTGETIESMMYKQYKSNAYEPYIRVAVNRINYIGGDTEEWYKNYLSKKKKSLSYRHYSSIYCYRDVKYLYGQPIAEFQRFYRKNSSVASVFTKKNRSSKIRQSELVFCNKAKIDQDIYDGLIHSKKVLSKWR